SLHKHPPAMTESQLNAVQREEGGITLNTARRRAGLEDPADLIADLQRALSRTRPEDQGQRTSILDPRLPRGRALVRRPRADRLGFHTPLVPELYLNDRKGIEAPSLEAWSLSAAILAATDRLRVMTAVRPGFHLPAVLAKTVSTLDSIAPGRVALNVVAAWWAEEARQFGGVFPTHDARYAQASEFVQVLNGLWEQTPFSFSGDHYEFEDTIVEPKPSSHPVVFAGGESDAGREAIAGFADAYVMHGGTL